MVKELEDLKVKYGIDVDLYSPVDHLSIGMQQKIEILKLLYTGADVLIFDEPTAILPPKECEGLFQIIKNLTKEGKGVIFISHKLEEVLDISDRITVLTKGKVTGEVQTKDADKAMIVRMMVGEEVSAPQFKTQPEEKHHRNEVVITASELCAKDDRGIQTLNGINLSIRKGEIVGVAGVEGNGQIELAEVLAGVRDASSGKVFFQETELSTKNPTPYIDGKISYVPADRNHVGCVPDFPLYENWILRQNHPPRKYGFLDYKKIKQEAAKAMELFDVRARGVKDRSGNLSGGNLQKFILARAISKNPNFLICEFPTRGLDIKATWFVRQKLFEARKEGLGVLLLSGDFEELLSLSDRIIVLYKGKIVGEVKPDETTVEEIGMMMMGVRKNENA